MFKTFLSVQFLPFSFFIWACIRRFVGNIFISFCVISFSGCLHFSFLLFVYLSKLINRSFNRNNQDIAFWWWSDFSLLKILLLWNNRILRCRVGILSSLSRSCGDLIACFLVLLLLLILLQFSQPFLLCLKLFFSLNLSLQIQKFLFLLFSFLLGVDKGNMSIPYRVI